MTTNIIPATIIPTTIILVRHGNTFESDQLPYYVGRKTDLPLTARGEQQAKEVAQELSRRSLRPSVFFSGELIRQQRTAEIIAQAMATQTNTPTPSINIAPCLSELDLGAWEGMTTDKVKQYYPAEYEAWECDSTWPQGIFLESKENRLLQLRDWLHKFVSDGNESPNISSQNIKSENVVLAVTSNGVLRLLYELIETTCSTREQDTTNAGNNTGDNVRNRITEPIKNHQVNRKVGTGCFCIATLTADSTADSMVLREWNTRPPTLARQ